MHLMLSALVQPSIDGVVTFVYATDLRPRRDASSDANPLVPEFGEIVEQADTIPRKIRIRELRAVWPLDAFQGLTRDVADDLSPQLASTATTERNDSTPEQCPPLPLIRDGA